MSEIKFACPGCQQHIQCDESYGGMEIACPACNTRMVVPGQAPAAPPALSAPPPVQAPVYSSATTSKGCPDCGAPLPRGAVLCTKCGYNTATGQRLSPQAAAARRGASVGGEEKWYQNPFIYAGAAALILGGLLVLAKTGGDAMQLPFLGAYVLYAFSLYIWTVVEGFRAGATQGIFCLICGIYQIYFVFKEVDSPLLKALYMVSLLFGILLKFGILDK